MGELRAPSSTNGRAEISVACHKVDGCQKVERGRKLTRGTLKHFGGGRGWHRSQRSQRTHAVENGARGRLDDTSEFTYHTVEGLTSRDALLLPGDDLGIFMRRKYETVVRFAEEKQTKLTLVDANEPRVAKIRTEKRKH